MGDVFKNWFNLESRLTRKAFICTMLPLALVMAILEKLYPAQFVPYVTLLWQWVVIFPVYGRRCNDMGVSRWFAWWYPVSNLVVFLLALLFVQMAKDSSTPQSILPCIEALLAIQGIGQILALILFIVLCYEGSKKIEK